MKKFVSLILLVFVLLCSCERINISQIYETPFPLEDLNSYVDIPYDSVAFTNGQGDTLRYDYTKFPIAYSPYKYHGEWWGNGETTGAYEGDGDEPEFEDEYGESYGMETYSAFAVYRDSSNLDAPYMQISYGVTERYIASMGVDWMSRDDSYECLSYGNELRFKNPSNDIFAFFKDSVYLNDCSSSVIINGNCIYKSCPNDHAIVAKGKGLVEFTLNGQIWRLIE